MEAAQNTLLAFFVHTNRIQFGRTVGGGREACTGQPAIMPLLPGVGFYYAVVIEGEQIKHLLIEAISGLYFAKADTRAGLHTVAAATARRWGLELTRDAIEKAVLAEAKTLYFISCPKPRKKKPAPTR